MGAPKTPRRRRATLVALAALSVCANGAVAGAITSPVNEPGSANAPYAVAILVNVDASVFEPQLFCSGALIAPDLVVTVGHCVVDFPASSLSVSVDSENVFDGTIHQVVDRVVHPGYEPGEGFLTDPLANDIALLRLDTPVTAITPVRLAPFNDAPLRGPRSQLRVFGFGIDETGDASGWLGRAPQVDVTGKRTSPYAGLDRNRQILARPRGAANPCVGDSGGPLVGNRPGKKAPFLVGLVSYGSDICGDGMPVVYTRVAGYRAWLNEAAALLRNRAGTTELRYTAADRRAVPLDGEPIVEAELTVSSERLHLTVTDVERGRAAPPDVVLVVADDERIVTAQGVRSADGTHIRGCDETYGRSVADGEIVWRLAFDLACLGERDGPLQMRVELRRGADGSILEQVLFARVDVPGRPSQRR